jgi:DNA-binding PadR family transcriptional regulator
MGEGRAEILQGTLDLMVLKTLEAMGPLHGYGIARRIEQISADGFPPSGALRKTIAKQNFTPSRKRDGNNSEPRRKTGRGFQE